MAEEYIPKWIAWETTQKCNLKCVHCRCSSDMLSSEGDFTTEEGKKLLKEISDFSKPVVVLSGGEPLLREDIFELAEYGTSLGLRMCMASNGALVTDEVCEKMKKADIKMVSLSGRLHRRGSRRLPLLPRRLRGSAPRCRTFPPTRPEVSY